MSYQLIRDAHVDVNVINGSTSNPQAQIVINDQFNHIFSPTSRVSKALQIMDSNDLENRLSGGDYFIVNDELVDFRDRFYTGFVQSDNDISRLMDILGVTMRESAGGPTNMIQGARLFKNNLITNDMFLGKVWSRNDISVPYYKQGGDFYSQLVFNWNPFVKTVDTLFQLVRMVCSNGMIGTTNFLNSKVPLVGKRTIEHLNIANKQIQHKVAEVTTNRIAQMGRERASVEEVIYIHEQSLKRLSNMKFHNEQAVQRLKSIAQITSPVTHLGNVYRENVFGDLRLAAQLPAHLTVFDVYNMSTELSSHTEETDGSSNLGLDRFSNKILFDRKDLVSTAGCFTAPALSSFSDPEAAFFGTMQ